jgi:hypothetical protein
MSNKFYGIGIGIVLILSISIIITTFTSIFLLIRPQDNQDSTSDVTPSPVPPNVTPSPVPPSQDLTDVYFDFMCTTPVYGTIPLYLRIEYLIDFSKFSLVRDIYISNNLKSGYIQSYSFKLDSNNNLLDNDRKYINLNDQNIVSFTNIPTIYTIRYDSESKKFLNQEGTKKLADVQGYLGINQIPYRVLNWVTDDSDVDIRYSNVANITTSITPTPKIGIKVLSSSLTRRCPVFLCLDNISLSLNFKCLSLCSISSIDISNNSICTFYIDNNNRIITNVDNISYKFLTYNDIYLQTASNPNIFCLYLTESNSSSTIKNFVIRTESSPSSTVKYLNMTVQALTNVCSNISWSESISTAYIFKTEEF